MDHILEMRGITKTFPGVLANDRIDLDLKRGQVHALLGENGAGKSTLMNILSGLYQPDSGEITVAGQKVRFHSSKDAIAAGIGMVYQHFELIPQLSVVENIILGVKQKREPFLDLKGAARRIARYTETYGMEIDPFAKVWQLSIGQQQWVEIIKALYRGAKVLVLDEPTAVLIPQEVDELFRMVRQFTRDGYSVIFISHKIKEVKEISDVVSVLRQGRIVASYTTQEVSKAELATKMVGREVNFALEKEPVTIGETALCLENVAADNSKGRKALKGVSFDLRQGEILGVAGVDGNGQSELVEVVTGLRKPTAGAIRLLGKDITGLHTRKILECGLSHIPEDRQARGLVLDMDLCENMILRDYYLSPHARGKFLDWNFIRRHTDDYVCQYDVRTPSSEVCAGTLSGGNQQKLILARELHAEPKVLIAMHATRGLDVGAIEYVHRRILAQREEGTAVLYISTEIEELLNLADRIAVFFRGAIMGIVRPAETTIKELGLMMAGAHQSCQDRASPSPAPSKVAG